MKKMLGKFYADWREEIGKICLLDLPSKCPIWIISLIPSLEREHKR